MIRFKIVGLCFCLVLGLFSCQNSGTQLIPDASPAAMPGNLYASGFQITVDSIGTHLLILDPWSRKDTFAQYTFDNNPKNYERWAVFSTTHIGFLDALGEADRVVGCTTPERIYHTDLFDKFKSGDLLRIGSDMEYNFESLLDQKPDLVIQTGFSGQKAKDQRLLDTGIDLIYIMEWLEPTPLGRAEWIKVFGLLLGKSAEAETIFNQIVEEYEVLKSIAQKTENKPLVMLGNNFKGTWYMPGGNNYMTRLLVDAGFDYKYLADRERGSIPLSFESVVYEFSAAPIWLGVSAKTMKELVSEDDRYKTFASFRNGQVYSLANRVKQEIRNDFWESGVVKPHLLLTDLIQIAHPELIDHQGLTFYKQLK